MTVSELMPVHMTSAVADWPLTTIFRLFRSMRNVPGRFEAILAAEIIKALDRQCLSVRAAYACTGIAAADFSRIRNADLGRFTVDRLISILNRLGSRVEIKVKVRLGSAA